VLSKRLVLAASLALLGCSSDKATAPTGLVGTFSFSYSGAISGTFNATGALPGTPAGMETTSWAAAEISTADGETGVLAATPRSASSHDIAGLFMERVTPGAATISDTCQTQCGFALMTFGQANGTGTTFLQECFITVGSITITEVTTTRVKGTFSGTGECLAFGSQTPAAFTVTNGTFDVALVTLP
jgi:hypothetical protein